MDKQTYHKVFNFLTRHCTILVYISSAQYLYIITPEFTSSMFSRQWYFPCTSPNTHPFTVRKWSFLSVKQEKYTVASGQRCGWWSTAKTRKFTPAVAILQTKNPQKRAKTKHFWHGRYLLQEGQSYPESDLKVQ